MYELEQSGFTQKGRAMKSRLNDPSMVSELVNCLVRSEDKRSQMRARVKGLIDGNPPYRTHDLRKAGQSNRSNVNYREAEAFLALALTAFYDIVTEAPTLAECRTNHGDDKEREEWSGIITEEYQRLNERDYDLDYTLQLSQHEMVGFGTGPIIYEDPWTFKGKAIQSGNLLVRDNTRSNVCEWSECVILWPYRVDEMYQFIHNEEYARDAGWNVPAVREAIMNSMPQETRMDIGNNWEKLQQRLRNNDLAESATANCVEAAIVFWKELASDKDDAEDENEEYGEGMISMAIVEQSRQTEKFLFRKERCYKSWYEAIHPMYYDKGDGKHHSVKGLAVKMYAALEQGNRLRNAMMDSTFARMQIILKPLSSINKEELNVIQLGPYSVPPVGFEVIQNNIAGVIDAPLAVLRDTQNLLSSNLSQYRQGLMEKDGNPITAKEVQFRAQQQATISKTQIARYYQQMDSFWAERFRRAANPDIPDYISCAKEAKEFQKRCKKRGVPQAALKDMEFVRATRVTGQGSLFLRQQTLTEILALSTQFPEEGRRNVISDWIASRSGQTNVKRYYPIQEPLPTTQDQVAAIENGVMMNGTPLPVTDSDDHIIHATAHLSAAAQGFNSIEKGGDPLQVARFVETAGPHILLHLQRGSQMSGKADHVKALSKQFEMVMQMQDKLRQKLQKDQEARAKQQAQAAQAQAQLMSEEERKRAAFVSEEQRKNAKTAGDLRRKEDKAKQDMALKDAKTASGIRLKQQQAQAQTAIKAQGQKSEAPAK